MRKIADGLWLLDGVPSYLVNVYLMQDVLVDAGTRWGQGRILRQLVRRPRLLALSHCHPDHQGSASVICRHLGIPLACHEADVAAMEGCAAMQPDNGILRLGRRLMAGPPHPVGQVLRDGDELAGFRVIHAPGHTPGHVIFFRECDRLALAGDLLANLHFLTLRPGLREPPAFFSANRLQNRDSVRRLAELQPATICFGHGPPLRDPRRLHQLIQSWNGG